MLKNLPEEVIALLTLLFNLFPNSGVFPPESKERDLCLTPKTGRMGFRPIALTSHVLKILERIVNDRLQY